MNYRYNPDFPRLFKLPPDRYPHVHLPVADFTGRNAAENARPFNGPSNMANLLLRCAVDSPEVDTNELAGLLRARRLWLTGTFRRALLGVADIHVDLQIGGGYTNLQADGTHGGTRLFWNQRGERTLIDAIRFENNLVFRLPLMERPTKVAHQTYDRPVDNEALTRNPVLPVAAQFTGLEEFALNRTGGIGDVAKAVGLHLDQLSR